MYLGKSPDLLLAYGGEILQCEAVLLEPINELGHAGACLHPHQLPLLIHVKYPIHQGQVDHPGPLQPDTVGREAGAHGPDLLLLSVGILDGGLEVSEGLGLEEGAGVDLVGPAPVGDGVEVVGEGGVAEELGLLVPGVLGEGEGVVGGGGGAQEEGAVP